MNRRTSLLSPTLMTVIATSLMLVAARSSIAQQAEPSGGTPAVSQPAPKSTLKPTPKSAPTTQKAEAERLSPRVIQSYPGVPKPTIVLKPGEIPAIKFDEPKFDFGRHADDSEVKHAFKFTNTGTGPLEILKVKPSCGCTVAGKFDRVIQPGDSGSIPVTFRTKRLSGQVKKNITVFTNAPAQERMALEIGGFIWVPLQATPKRATFGILKVEQATEGVLRKLTLQNNVEAPAQITDLRCTNPLFSAEVEILEPGKQFELTVSLKGEVPPGSHQGRVEFSTGLKERPTVEIPVDAYIQADVDVMPAKISLSPQRKSDTERRLIVRNGTDVPLSVTRVTTTDPALIASVSESKPGFQFIVTLTIPKSYLPKLDGDAILIDTNSPTMPQVKVPVELRRLTKPVQPDRKPPKRTIPKPPRPVQPQGTPAENPIQEKKPILEKQTPAPKAGTSGEQATKESSR